MENILKYPDYISFETEEKKEELEGKKERVMCEDVNIWFELNDNCMEVFLSAKTSKLRMVKLRWNFEISLKAEFLGDEWERSYGHTQWMKMSGCHFMPWYFFISKELETVGVRC